MVQQERGALFREVQQFRQVWYWGLILLAAGVVWTAFIQQIILGKPFGDNPSSDTEMWIVWLIIGIGLPLFLYVANLTVEVRKDGIYLHFFPLYSRRIPMEVLKTYQVRTYSPIWEYGGWGIRYSLGKGWAFNVSGNQGVQLELYQGKPVLIGSRRAEELVLKIQEALRVREK